MSIYDLTVKNNKYKKPQTQIRMTASQVRKATLAEVSAAFDEAKAENRRRLENAGNEIVAVNDRAGKQITNASNRINGAQYDYFRFFDDSQFVKWYFTQTTVACFVHYFRDS